MTLTIGSLFAGIGGLDLGVEAALGGTVRWQVECDRYAASQLERHWPDAVRYGDVTTVDWTTVEPVDVLCGGYPCQPFSHAGNRKGETDDRHLWPHFAAAIRTLRPRYAVLENVAGHLSLGFGRVLGDLAEIGYDARWTSVRASDVGAPHRRERVFIVAEPADAASGGRGGRPTRAEPAMAGRDGVSPERSEGGGELAGNGRAPADAERAGTRLREGSGRPRRPAGRPRQSALVRPGDRPTCAEGVDASGPAPADTGSQRYGGRENAGGVGRLDRGDAGAARERERTRPLASGRSGPAAADAARDGRGKGRTGASQRSGSAGQPASDRRAPAHADGEGLERRLPLRSGRGERAPRTDGLVDWGTYGPAIARWEAVMGRPAPVPTDDRRRLNADLVEWMMGFPEGWTVGKRAARLRCYGNAVVWQQAAYALSLLLPDTARRTA